MKKKTREKKFICPYAGPSFGNIAIYLVNNCYYFGCIHQINGDCPILRQAQGGNK